MNKDQHGKNIVLRKAPYPYSALIAICSDLDETSDRHRYYEIMRFLNTKEETLIGRGVGLEVGNTIYFDMPSDQFSYWNTDEAGREMVRDLIFSGHIDCLHSYGDFVTTREQVQRCVDELNRHDCQLKVWVDHGTASTNFGSDIMKGSGDLIGNLAYHADLTLGLGIEYVWRGRVSSIIGQDTRRSYRGILNPNHYLLSSKTILKEYLKGLLGTFGYKKYIMHESNMIFHKINMRNGNEIYEFMRCNPYWGGAGLGATALGISDVLVEKMLQNLVNRQGFCILYTHLGKNEQNLEIFNEKTKQAFSLLAQYMFQGKILVTTTRRLLDYCRMKNEISVSTQLIDDTFQIHLYYTRHKMDLDGLTIYIPKTNVKVWLNQKEIYSFRRNPPDQTGQDSISFPWNTLEFPNVIY